MSAVCDRIIRHCPMGVKFLAQEPINKRSLNQLSTKLLFERNLTVVCLLFCRSCFKLRYQSGIFNPYSPDFQGGSFSIFTICNVVILSIFAFSLLNQELRLAHIQFSVAQDFAFSILRNAGEYGRSAHDLCLAHLVMIACAR